MSYKILKNEKNSFTLNDVYYSYLAVCGYIMVGLALFCLYIVVSKFSYSVDDLAISIFSLVNFLVGYKLSKSMGTIEFTYQSINFYKAGPFGIKQNSVNTKAYRYIKISRRSSTNFVGANSAFYEMILSKSKKDKCDDDIDLDRYWKDELDKDISIFLRPLIKITEYSPVFDKSYDGEFDKLKESLREESR
jgi:hypothetical protein